MNRIALIRSNPKDEALGKTIGMLSSEYKIQCFIWDRQNDYQPTVENANISYIRCSIRAGFYDMRTFLKLFLFEAWLFSRLIFAGVDCIHSIDLDTGLIGLFVATMRRKPFVYQCFDPYYTLLPKNWPAFLARIARQLENFVITHADLFIITDLLRLPQHEGARPKRVVEIANVPHVDLSQCSGNAKKGFVVGYIGSLAAGRNLLTIVEAAGELKDEGVQLVIGGFGPVAAEVSEASGKYDNVTYTSWVPYKKLIDLESGFDLFVYVTNKENEAHKWVSPNKLFESMAFGRPIIVGEGTLSAQRVAAIGNGVVVRYDAKEQLKESILSFKNNPALAREMGGKGKTEFEHNWRPEIMKKRLLDAYARLGKEMAKHGSVACGD